jgi:hypothetical protein
VSPKKEKRPGYFKEGHYKKRGQLRGKLGAPLMEYRFQLAA